MQCLFCLSHAGRIDADDQAPTKIIFDPLFSRFNERVPVE